MRIKRGGQLLAGGAIVVVALVGCGGGGQSTSSTAAVKVLRLAPPIRKAEFIAKANDLCERERVAAERKGLGVLDSKAQLYIRHGDLNEFKGSIKRQEVSIVLAPSLRRRIGDVRKLGLPKGDEEQAEAVLQAIGKAAKTAQENPFGALSEGAFRRPRALARAYGIESCAVLYEAGGLYDRGSANPGVRATPRSSK